MKGLDTSLMNSLLQVNFKLLLITDSAIFFNFNIFWNVLPTSFA